VLALEAGLKLDINHLRRAGTIRPHWDGQKAGSLRVRYPDGFEQEILFTSRPRHFGGRQYFSSVRDGPALLVLLEAAWRDSILPVGKHGGGGSHIRQRNRIGRLVATWLKIRSG